MRKCCIPLCTFYSEFTRCHKHAVKGDLNFNYQYRCQEHECYTFPYYGPVDGKRVRCSRHRLCSDVNLNHCFYTGCCRPGRYKKDGIQNRYCIYHIPDYNHNDYVNIKMCKFPGCRVSPNYGDIKEGIPIYCSRHKTTKESNLRMANKASKLCAVEGCKKERNFGPHGKRVRCSLHRLQGDTITASRICVQSGCGKIPTFGPPSGNKRTHCRIHMDEGDINIIKRNMIRKNEELSEGEIIDVEEPESKVSEYITGDYIDDFFNLRDVPDVSFGFNFDNDNILN